MWRSQEEEKKVQREVIMAVYMKWVVAAMVVAAAAAAAAAFLSIGFLALDNTSPTTNATNTAPTNAANTAPTTSAATLAGAATFHRLRSLVDETSWYNDIVLGAFIPKGFRAHIPHAAQSWLRNYLGGLSLYFLLGGLWSLYIYHWKKHVFFPHGSLPSKDSITLQIVVSMQSMPWFTSLPVISEFFIEKGWTKCYVSIKSVGVCSYIGWSIMYLLALEFAIYWMHRGLHDIKPLYKWLHSPHHTYNKENMLSPFAGYALHPLDGLLQALPHALLIFFIPTHLRTHEFLIFLDGIWTINIHDCIHGNVWPLMGAGYHTIHHTTYRHNYGHYTIWIDWMFGTLKDPSINGRLKNSF